MMNHLPELACALLGLVLVWILPPAALIVAFILVWGLVTLLLIRGHRPF